MVPPAAAQRETGPTQWMSLWRHESSSCRKPRLSTEHCCRLHTLAIFGRRRCHSLCRHGLAAAVPVPPPGAPPLSRRHRVPRPEDPKARETRRCLRNCDAGAPAGPGVAGVSAGSRGSRARECGAGAGAASFASESSGFPFSARLSSPASHTGLEPRRAPPAMSPDWRWPM